MVWYDKWCLRDVTYYGAFEISKHEFAMRWLCLQTLSKSRSIFASVCSLLLESVCRYQIPCRPGIVRVLNARGIQISCLVGEVVLALLLFLHMAIRPHVTWMKMFSSDHSFLAFKSDLDTKPWSVALSSVGPWSWKVIVYEMSFSPGSSVAVAFQHARIARSLAMDLGKISLLFLPVDFLVF